MFFCHNLSTGGATLVSNPVDPPCCAVPDAGRGDAALCLPRWKGQVLARFFFAPGGEEFRRGEALSSVRVTENCLNGR